MKTSFHPRVAGLIRRPKSGFALVVTLSLMILLTVIAVGLLTLSSISLRASAQGQATAEARANARLALMLAIGDLQKSLGPDRAISASSEILAASPAKPHTTGVWESWWDFNPNSASLDYTGEKQKRFRRWLVSNADPAVLETRDFATAKWTGKLTDLDQAELFDNARGKIKPLRHDLTPWSLGVMADVRGGGLKQDLSSVFERNTTLPPGFGGMKLYHSTHGITGVSDPYWSTLSGYYNSFRNITDPEGKTDGPKYAVTTGAATTDPVPKTYNPAPVIEKVDTIFSLVSRPFNDFSWLALDTYDYMVSLIFTPVVTLHNPYNVNISFHSMKVTFLNVPIAFNFMLQKGGAGPFESQSVEPGKFESPNTMIASSPADRHDKTFEMSIANWSDTKPLATSTAISGPIVMKPGQTLVCGPCFDPNGSFKNDTGAGGGPSDVAFDWQNRLTDAIKAKPSFTPGLGFETAAVNIKNLRTMGSPWSICMLRDSISPSSSGHVTDNFYIEFQAQKPSWYLNDTPGSTSKNEAAPSFEVSAQLQTTATSSPIVYAKLKFDYQDDPTLKNFFDVRVYRYPPTAPTDSLTGHGTAAPGGILYSAQAPYLHPFAIMSAYARTTNGGVYETGKRTKGPVDSPQLNLLKDGRLAGKPFLFHNPSRANMTMDLASEKPGVQSYELNFQPFLSKGDYQDYMDVDGNRVPALTGNTTARGIKSGSYP